MISARSCTTKNELADRRPTEYLAGTELGELTAMMAYRLIIEGFVQADAQAMLAAYAPCSSNLIMSRILGKSSSKYRRCGGHNDGRLTPQQSATAFLYAKVFENAISVFSTPPLADDWLNRPCKHLDGEVPLHMVDNIIGFQAVEAYLDRVRWGVYQ
jgi:putative toxin-antitoxin system antitoxin component (TIGR02293 family)